MLINRSLSPGSDSVNMLDVSGLNWLLIDLTEYALVFMNETINFHCFPLLLIVKTECFDMVKV